MKAFLLAAGLICCQLTELWSATGRNGAAATVQPLATDAALAAMKKGGNAIDGAVAAALALGVVDGHNSGIRSEEHTSELQSLAYLVCRLLLEKKKKIKKK